MAIIYSLAWGEKFCQNIHAQNFEDGRKHNTPCHEDE